MPSILPSTFLRRALSLDAITSGAVALLQLAAGGVLANLFALPRAVLTESGLFLVVYVALLVAMARAKRLPVALVKLVIAGNLAWALGCAALAIGDFVPFNRLGTAYLLVQVVAVLVFAVLEAQGLARSHAIDVDREALAR